MNNWRINLILFTFLLIGAAIISRLFFLTIINHKFYQAQALGQQAGFEEIMGLRGEVFLQNTSKTKGSSEGQEIKSFAINKSKWTVAARPQEIQDQQSFAETLSKAINEPEKNILAKIENQSSYIIIKKDLSDDEVSQLKKLQLKGLSIEETPARYYPQEKLASKAIGFLGGDKIGQYGLEGYYEELLKGKKGIKEEKKGLGIINSDNDQESLNGADLYLTIDYNIQFEAESLLKEAKKDLDIESGQIIVLKPDSGRILAMADYPNFDPNQYSKENNFDIFQNSSVQKLFEPGSILKPFTMAIALNEGKIIPDSTFVDNGFVKFGQYTISNYDKKIYGLQTMTAVLEKSINTGAVYVSQLIPHETFLDYLAQFGFGKKTGIDLQGEVYSKNENLRNGQDLNFATASFGQGIEITPIQLAAAFCALANGGKLVKPYIVEKIKQQEKEEITKPQLSDQIISAKTSSDIIKMLISVMDNGFGKPGRISGYYLAGKTGTAQIPLKGERGYEPDKTIQSFIGFGPAFNPQFVLLVKLDDPKVSVSSISAAPIFKAMAQYIINYWQIPPDYQ